MSKLCLAIFGAAFALGAAPALGDDNATKPLVQGETPKDRAKAERVKAATTGGTESHKEKPLMGDFKSPNDPLRGKPQGLPTAKEKPPPPKEKPLVGDSPIAR